MKNKNIFQNDNLAAVFTHILICIADDGYTPTLDEVGSKCYLSTGCVSKLVKKLVDQGCLVRDGRGWRNLRLPDTMQVYIQESINGQMRMIPTSWD